MTNEDVALLVSDGDLDLPVLVMLVSMVSLLKDAAVEEVELLKSFQEEE